MNVIYRPHGVVTLSLSAFVLFKLPVTVNVLIIFTKIFMVPKIFRCSTLKKNNVGLNTTQCWVNIGPNACWVVFKQQLG